MISFRTFIIISAFSVCLTAPSAASAQEAPPLSDIEKVINLAKEMEAKHGADIRKKARDMAVDIQTNHPEELEAAKRMGRDAYRKAVKNLRDKRAALIEAERNGTLTEEQKKELALMRQAQQALKSGLQDSHTQQSEAPSTTP